MLNTHRDHLSEAQDAITLSQIFWHNFGLNKGIPNSKLRKAQRNPLLAYIFWVKLIWFIYPVKS
jgi:hypothetical protein